MEKKLNIKTPSDWGKVTVQQFYAFGGSSLLKYHHNGSLFTCLQSVYKGIIQYLFKLKRYKLEKRMV
jgi:hypothetical protein